MTNRPDVTHNAEENRLTGNVEEILRAGISQAQAPKQEALAEARTFPTASYSLLEIMPLSPLYGPGVSLSKSDPDGGGEGRHAGERGERVKTKREFEMFDWTGNGGGAELVIVNFEMLGNTIENTRNKSRS